MNPWKIKAGNWITPGHADIIHTVPGGRPSGPLSLNVTIVNAVKFTREGKR